MTARQKKWGAFALALALIAGFSAWRRSRPLRVEVISPVRKDVTITLAFTGQVEAVNSARLSSRLPSATVRRVLVDKGDNVTAGQVVVELDDRDLQAAVNRARAGVLAAEAGIDRALAQRNGAWQTQELARQQVRLSTELKSQRDQAAADVQTARERLDNARQALKRTRLGARQESIRQAEARLRQAIIQRDLAVKSAARRKSLLDMGAISREQYDIARAEADAAEEAVRSAQFDVKQLSEPRTEDVRQAEAVVREAEAGLAGARTALANAEDAYRQRLAARQSLASAEDQTRVARQDVSVAQANLSQARAALAEAEANLAKAVVRSPVTGVVTERSVEPGETVSAGQTLLAVADRSRLRVRADVDESDIGSLKPGQPAVVSPDAYPDMRIPGRLSVIGDAVNPERGTVEVRIALDRTPPELRPELTVDVNIVTDRFQGVLTLPRAAVLEPSGASAVRVIRHGRIEQVPVRVVEGAGQEVVVREGLAGTEMVLRNPGAVSVGQRATARKASGP